MLYDELCVGELILHFCLWGSSKLNIIPLLDLKLTYSWRNYMFVLWYIQVFDTYIIVKINNIVSSIYEHIMYFLGVAL